MNTEHVWLYDGSISCTHCGQSPDLDAMSIVAAIDVLRGFLLMHRRCEKPVEPSKQVELFDALKARESAVAVMADADRGLKEDRSGIDASTDDPAPEIDPPARHGTGPILDAIELRHLVTCVRPKEAWPTVKQVEDWHQDVRSDVQRWCQVEHAHARPIAGMTLPDRFPMPEALDPNCWGKGLPHPKKKGARPLANPKGRKTA